MQRTIVTEMPEPKVRKRLAPKTKTLSLKCPNCGKVFFRTETLARTVTTCPACQARLTFNKAGKTALIKQVKYALEDPKHVRSYFNELKQHKVSFRTRMQWLSRIYGGKGGYTSEELYKIVTGKTVSGYYIFPFVKGAPPEVNRILERTYRTHRGAGDTKVASAIAAWNKVKQVGYVKVTKPAPTWVKRRYNMEQLKPMQVVTTGYGLGAGMGGLAERGVRGLFGAARRHPKITRGAGAFGVGYLTAKELAKRRKRKKGYALDVRHFTPDIPLNRVERLGKRFPTKRGLLGVGKRLGHTTSSAIKLAIVGLAAKEILEQIAKRRPGMAWMPEIKPDIELSGPGYEVLDRVVAYASITPTKALQMIKAKAGAALHKTKVGAERGLLMWLMGFISAELLSRGITKPKRRHEVVFPKEAKGYRLRVGETGEMLPRRGFHTFTPVKTKPEPLPKWKRHRLRRVAKKAGAAATLPIGALLAIRVLRERRGTQGYSFEATARKAVGEFKGGFKHPKLTKLVGKKGPPIARAGAFVRRRPGLVAGVTLGTLALRELRKIRKRRAKEGYSFLSAAKRTAKVVGKVGGGLGKTLGVASNIAIPALIVSELWPRKKKRLAHPPVQSPLMQPYKFKGLKQLLKLGKAKKTPVVGHKIRDLTLSRKDPAMAELNKRLAAAAQKHKKHFQLAPDLNHYLFATKAGRQWIQNYLDSVEKYPFKSAAQRRWMHWKKPKMAKKWEEHTPEGKELPEHVSKHALSVPWALKRARDLMRLKGARGQGREIVAWAKKLAGGFRVQQLKAVDAKTKATMGAMANRWDTVASQVEDALGRAQLEKVGLLAAAAAAGTAGHEVGKKRERARVRRVVG